MVGVGISVSTGGLPYSNTLIAFMMSSSCSGGFAIGAKTDYLETADILVGDWSFIDVLEDALRLLTNAGPDRRWDLLSDLNEKCFPILRLHSAALHLAHLLPNGSEPPSLQ